MFLSVVGVRPQFVKLVPICKAIKDHIIVHTGQHYDYEMSQAFFDNLSLPEPDYYLNVGSGSHAYQIAEIIKRLEKVLIKERPKIVINYGDTNSTLAGALTSGGLGIPSAHVEAGLRSFDMTMPEERNRRVVDHISDLLFTPTKIATRNLLAENIPKTSIFNVGDVMYDVFLELKKKIKPFKDDYYLATIHREANTDNKDKLKNILDALDCLDSKVILPLHPRTRKMIHSFGLKPGKNIEIMEPVNYTSFLSLLFGCKAVLTDSGGVQKEAFFAKRPCITLRENTEWVETIELKANILVGSNKRKIINAVRTISKRKPHWRAKPYGNGKAARRIALLLERMA